MGREAERVAAGGERSVGAGGDVKAAVTGDHSSATYIENQYVQRTPPEPVAPTPEETDEALRRYAERVWQTYGLLDLDVLIPTEEADHPAVGLREVFVPPFVRMTLPSVELPGDLVERLMASGEWSSELPEGSRRVDTAHTELPLLGSLDAVADAGVERLVLLGDPGAGKSTLVRLVALALTGGTATGALEPLDGRLPLVVELREYAAGAWRERTFEDFLDHLHTSNGMAPPRAVTEQLLGSGRAVVFFDGLDELFDPAAREQVAHRIADFAGRYRTAGIRVVVTSRVIGYRRGVLERAGFEHVMLQDLTDEQIGSFARHWYGTAFPHDRERAMRLCERLTGAVARSRPVRELARNPLLLTILAIIGRRRELPRDRHGVYRHAVAVLVAHWDEHTKYLKGPGDPHFLDEEDRRELLRLVARKMQDGQDGIAGNHIHRDDLLTVFKNYLRLTFELPPKEAVVVARGMVDLFRERNFILSHYGGGVYGFVHRAFLEYLAAEDIERRYTRGREWTREEFIEHVVLRRAGDPAWHEVLLLLVGRLEDRDAAAVVDALLDLHRRYGEPENWRLLVLAVRALSEVRRLGRLAPQSRAVADALIGFLETVDQDSEKVVELDAVLPVLSAFPPHWTGRGRILRWFHLRGQFNRHADRTAVKVAARLYGGRDVPEVLAVHAPSDLVRRGALSLLAERWGDDPDVQGLLRARAVEDSVAGLEPLVEHAPDDPWVRRLLWDLSLHHQEAGTRRWTLELLCRCAAGDEDLRDHLRARAVEDTAGWVRYGALEELARSWEHDPDTWALVEERSAADSHEMVRGPGAFLLWRHLTREAGVDELLYGVGLDDRVIARMRTLGFVGAGHRDPVAVRHLARESAVGEADARVRGFALRLLARDSCDEQGTWTLMRDRAVNDPDQRVRQEAARMLAQHQGEEAVEEAPPLTAGEDRARTLRTLAQSRGDHPDARRLLREYATTHEDVWFRVGALRALTACAREEHGTWELVRELLAADPNATVRHHALLLWAGRGPGDAEAAQVMASRVTEDLEPGFRFSALRWWAVYDSGEAPAAAARDRAALDPEDRVRTAALRLLAFGWPSHPDTVPFLRGRVEAERDEGVRGAAADALRVAEALVPVAEQFP
ncbi:NACHT domain-containing protein [Streptomyces sp. NPDC047461]|uniref:NACHT domain-containing protein n=1 Tax=Streptomyces sp. NPDC047461 TaxID=3155619 RepID=UPI0033C2AB2E